MTTYSDMNAVETSPVFLDTKGFETAKDQDLPKVIEEMIRSGSFDVDEEKEKPGYETDSGSNSLVSSGGDETDPVPSKKGVTWAETVVVREECFDASANKYDTKDTHEAMKKAAAVKPTVQRITFSPEEEAIRSKLVGLIPAEKRRHHDYGRMYNCGPCLARTDSSADLEEDSDLSDDDEDFEIKEPVRIIHASEPSAIWLSATLF